VVSEILFVPCNLVINKVNFISVSIRVGSAIAQAVSRRLLTTEVRVHAQVSPCGICGGQSDTGIGFSSSPLVFPCQYNSTDAPS
jgi:hypothetical protein